MTKGGNTIEPSELLGAIVADSDDAILSKDLNGTILSWNRAAVELFGFSESEAVGMPVGTLIPPDRVAEETEIMRRLVNGERIHHLHTHRLRKDKSPLDVVLTISPIRSGGEIIGASVIARHLTEDGVARKVINRAEQRFREIFDRSSQGIAISTVDGQILQANAALARMLGFKSPQELQRAGLKAGSFYSNPNMREEILNLLRDQGAVENVEVELVRPDGATVWVSMNMVPILDSFGGMSGLQTMVTDITLKRRVEQQLLEAQKMDSVGRLTGGIAHDFNNLLSVMLNYLDFAMKNEIDETVRKDLLEVRAAAERAAALVRQLLTFSRRDLVNPEIIDINKAVDKTHQLLERSLGEDIELDVNLGENLWHVEISPVHLEQILLNLAVNARDAMPKGGTLAVTTSNVTVDRALAEQHTELEEGPYVSLSVADTGVGMSEQTRRGIFEPFFTTKPRDLGTGLGLATVHGIVASAGGTIAVYSEPGLGSAFHVYFPATQAPLTEVPAAAKQEVTKGDESVLIVDDEPALARIAERILQTAGFSVYLAASAKDALRIAESEPIDLLLTDVVMPSISGHDLALRVRELVPHLRVLLMSGYSEELLARRGFFQIDHSLVPKPFAADQLLNAIRDTLDEDPEEARARWRSHVATAVVIDDDDDVRQAIMALLHETGCTVIGDFSDVAEGLGVVRTLGPDFVILDTMMPGTNVDMAAKALRTQVPHVRVIAVSGTSPVKPRWADALVEKSRLVDLRPALINLTLVPYPKQKQAASEGRATAAEN